VPQKLNVNLFFDIEFFKYFFRVLHETSSSWLKLFRAFQLHPVYNIQKQNQFLGTYVNQKVKHLVKGHHLQAMQK
jgi:hypothetical protein